jgi:hypothetical protein
VNGKSRNPFLTRVVFKHIRRIIQAEEKVLSVTFVESMTKFDGCRPNYRDLTSKVDQNGFCFDLFLSHGKGLPDGILSICLAQENHSGKLIISEMPCSVRQ